MESNFNINKEDFFKVCSQFTLTSYKAFEDTFFTKQYTRKETFFFGLVNRFTTNIATISYHNPKDGDSVVVITYDDKIIVSKNYDEFINNMEHIEHIVGYRK